MLPRNDFSITQLDEYISIDSFSCGNGDMDDWFTKQSLQQQLSGTTKVYICQSMDGDVVGFYTLSGHYLQKRTFSEESKQGIIGGNVPVVLLGMLGVSEFHKGEGVGHYLVGQAKFMAARSAQIIAARFLYVQAREDSLIDWYRSQGFLSMPKNNRNMIFDLQTLPIIS